MMAAEDTDTIEKLDNFKVHNNHDEMLVDISAGGDSAEYGLPLKEVYKLAYNFYKGKNAIDFTLYIGVIMIFFQKKKVKRFTLVMKINCSW